MDSRTLRDLARILGLPVRTVQRAVTDGLIHAEGRGARRLVTSREERYLVGNWDLLRGFRDALRTEPRIRLAVLFGSAATGDAAERSDLDLLVDLNHGDEVLGAEAIARVEARVGRGVRPTSLQDAEVDPSLLTAILCDGRVLVDRDGSWATLGAPRPAGQPGRGAKFGVSPAGKERAAAEAADEGAGELEVAIPEGQPEQCDRIARGAHDPSV